MGYDLFTERDRVDHKVWTRRVTDPTEPQLGQLRERERESDHYPGVVHDRMTSRKKVLLKVIILGDSG
ncbi:hypothetical protein J4Q44_G00083200 [Coregonus suidteri]|uniref:Uncharacterized protein n=1 Tax=Coregonus suidteri TaxID=861788 RepID=A0AAN8M2Y2_9TELE